MTTTRARALRPHPLKRRHRESLLFESQLVAVVHIEASVTVKAPREKVFAAYTDFESMKKWSKTSASVLVTDREGDMVYLEAGASSGRRSRMGSLALRLTQPRMVESESETMFTRTKRRVAFEEVPEGTRVTATLDVEVKGLWSKIMATREREEFEPEILQELESFAQYVEGLPRE